MNACFCRAPNNIPAHTHTPPTLENNISYSSTNIITIGKPNLISSLMINFQSTKLLSSPVPSFVLVFFFSITNLIKWNDINNHRLPFQQSSAKTSLYLNWFAMKQKQPAENTLPYYMAHLPKQWNNINNTHCWISKYTHAFVGRMCIISFNIRTHPCRPRIHQTHGGLFRKDVPSSSSSSSSLYICCKRNSKYHPNFPSNSNSINFLSFMPSIHG